MGLQKIYEKHLSDFSDFAGRNPQEKLAEGISEIIAQGKIIEKDGVKTIWHTKDDKNFVVGLSKGWEGKGENLWIITSYEKTKGDIPREFLRGDNLNLSAYKAEFNPLLTSSDEPLNNEIIQHTADKIQQKMQVSRDFAENLAKWHKDSHELTKNADGTPKVFYHSTPHKFETFNRQKIKSGQWGFWFSPSKAFTKNYGNNTYEVFLKINKLFDIFEPKNMQILEAILTPKDIQATRNFHRNVHNRIAEVDDIFMSAEEQDLVKGLIKKGYDGIKINDDEIVVLNPNQIKAIDNKGTFDSSNPNIYHANATLGGGVLGGSYAGLEYDENGEIIGFSPQKFALGFASGAGLSKGLQISAKRLEKLASKNQKAKALLERIQGKNTSNATSLHNAKILDTISSQKLDKGKNMHITQNQNGDYLLKDSEGKNHIVRKEVAQEWVKEFGLSDLSQSYKPNLSEPIKNAINKDIEINTKDLLKLINKGRTKYIKNIKSTFENPKMVFIDEKDDLIFAKELSDRLFFVSVSRDYGDNYLNITLSPKKDTILQNKLKKSKKVIFDKGS